MQVRARTVALVAESHNPARKVECEMARAAVSILAAVALTMSTAASASQVRRLSAWTGPSRANPSLVVGVSASRIGGPLVKHLRAGLYRIQVRAPDDMPFHLLGPGVDRRTAYRPPTWCCESGKTVYVTWTVRLKRGVYRYRAEGPWAQFSRADGRRIGGFFTVS